MDDLDREIHNAIFFITDGCPIQDAFHKHCVEEAFIRLATELYGKAYIDNIEYIEEEF